MRKREIDKWREEQTERGMKRRRDDMSVYGEGERKRQRAWGIKRGR